MFLVILKRNKMIQVSFTSHLEVFFPNIQTENIEAKTLEELLDKLNIKYLGLNRYILEDNCTIRKHVNIFLDSIAIVNKNDLSVSVENCKEVFIMQALSGG